MDQEATPIHLFTFSCKTITEVHHECQIITRTKSVVVCSSTRAVVCNAHNPKGKDIEFKLLR